MKKTFLVILGIALLFSCGNKDKNNKDPKPQENYTSVEITANELGYSLNQDLETLVLPDYWYTLQSTYNRSGVHQHTMSFISNFPLLPQRLDLSEAKFNDEIMTEFSEGIYIFFSSSPKASNVVNYKFKDKAETYRYNVGVTMSLPDSFSIKSAPTVISKGTDFDIEISKNITNSDHTELQVYQDDNNGHEVLIASLAIDASTHKIHLKKELLKELSTDRVAKISIVSNKYGSKLVDAKKHIFQHSITCELGSFEVKE